ANKYAAERGKEVHAQRLKDGTGKSPGLKDILLSIRLLLCNVPFMLINLAAAFDGILVAGFSTFMPKFIEFQFGYPAGTAALYVGLVVVPTGGGATLASGYLVRRFNMKMRGILKFCTVLSALLCFFALAFLMECRNAPFAGVTLPYGQANTHETTFLGKKLNSSCNAGCACTEQDYYPMCGRDNVLYFSPCYAGCTEVFQDGDDKVG
ncbi:solute carrier organic anion transporter family member, partial [Elysia marginata]